MTTPLKTGVLVADDHAVVRHGVRSILDAEPDFQIVAEAADGAEAVAMALARLPHLVILDVSMPRLTGIQAAGELGRRAPGIRVLMLSMHDDEQYFFEALRVGASGYVLKSAVDRDLVEACRATMRGESGWCAPRRSVRDPRPRAALALGLQRLDRAFEDLEHAGQRRIREQGEGAAGAGEGHADCRGKEHLGAQLGIGDSASGKLGRERLEHAIARDLSQQRAHVVGEVRVDHPQWHGADALLLAAAEHRGHGLSGLAGQGRPAVLAQRGQVEPLLAAEVAGDHRGVDPRALADLADRGRLVAALVEQLARGAQQRLAAGLGVVRTARGAAAASGGAGPARVVND